MDCSRTSLSSPLMVLNTVMMIGATTDYGSAGEAPLTSSTTNCEKGFDEKPAERASLPKSISIRSSAYFNMTNHDPHGANLPTTIPSLVLDVYNQGMLKTELCNNWQETGDCPHHGRCRFAHGFHELRPVIRHPRFKTQVCRMVLTGGLCPFGHRCYFRHNLIDQEEKRTDLKNSVQNCLIMDCSRTSSLMDLNTVLRIGASAGGSGVLTMYNNRVAPSREGAVTSSTNNDDGFEEKPAERASLPKSISIRSSAYLKMNDAPGAMLPSIPAVENYYPPLELDVYNQGMLKTELCDKWQQTGFCPYRGHCRFAHGIRELRPVVRHPRYKTKVCRMVLTGGSCLYDHRCHFRHALTDQEKKRIIGTTTTS